MKGNLFGWSEEFWHWIDQIGILLGVAMGISWFAGLILAIFSRETIRRWLTRNRFPQVGGEADEQTWEGIVFTVSNKEGPLYVIERLKPQAIGLLASRETQVQAIAIRDAALKMGITAHEPVLVENPDDPEDSHQKVRWLLERMGNLQHRAVDITGGKKPMSLGAFMAAEETGAHTLYLSTDNLRQPNLRTARIVAISQPE